MLLPTQLKNCLGAATLALAGCAPDLIIPPLDAAQDTHTTTLDSFTSDGILPDATTDTPTQDTPSETASDTSSLRTESPYLRFICAYPSDISRSLIVCPREGSRPNEIFTYNSSSTARPIMASLREDIMDTMASNRSLANIIIPIPDSPWSIITASNGFYVINNNTSGMNHFIPFPTGFNTGGGAAVVGNSIYIATGNLDGTNYRPGSILVYPITPSSATASGVVGNFTRSITTPNVNPTGLARWNDGTRNYLVALCSGAFSGADRRASVFIYNTGTNSVLRTIDLGTVTASVSGHLAISGNQLVIGTAAYTAGDGTFFVVNLQDGTIQRNTVAGDTFHSSNQILGGAGVLVDFNSARATAFSLSNPSQRAMTSLGLTNPGPSFPLDNSCMVVVGQNAGVRVCVGM